MATRWRRPATVAVAEGSCRDAAAGGGGGGCAGFAAATAVAAACQEKGVTEGPLVLDGGVVRGVEEEEEARRGVEADLTLPERPRPEALAAADTVLNCELTSTQGMLRDLGVGSVREAVKRRAQWKAAS